MRNNSAPKLWIDTPQSGDHIGAWSTEQIERMNQEFTAAGARILGGRRERDRGESNLPLETPMMVTRREPGCASSASDRRWRSLQEGDQLGEDTVTIIRCFRWRMLPLPKVVRGVVVWQAL